MPQDLFYYWKFVLFDPLHPFHPPPMPHFWEPPIVPCFYEVDFFFIQHISENILYLSFSALLILLTTMPSGSIYAVANSRSPTTVSFTDHTSPSNSRSLEVPSFHLRLSQCLPIVLSLLFIFILTQGHFLLLLERGGGERNIDWLPSPMHPKQGTHPDWN